MESILTSIKKLIGITEEDDGFDTDIIIHINTAFMALTDLKVGPSTGFIITDSSTVWTDFISDPKKLAASKTYVYLRVKLLFDSESLSSTTIASMERQIDKLEWLLNVGAESGNAVNTPSSGDGINGIDGVDGFSPIVNIEEIDGGNRITITDAYGTETFDVLNGISGVNGKDGYTPVKGVDYFDGKDGTNGVDGYTPIKGIDYFDGVKGDPFTYEDFTPEQLEALKGKDGKDYVLTEADKTEIANTVVALLPKYEGEVSEV